MKISVAIVWTLWSFIAHQTVDCVTVRPSEISITTSKPTIKALIKSNKTIIGEVQITSDSRIRRLIPFMSYFYPGDDYNHQPSTNYLPVHPSVALRKKPEQSQFPSIAYLYGGSPKYQMQRPAVQAGFIYKARPEPYRPYAHTAMQPQMQPSYNSYKYQPLNNEFRPNVQHKSLAVSDKNQFNPFSEANKLPGDFVPIFNSKNLPYKSYDDSALSHENHKHIVEKMKPLDESEFLPMNPAHKFKETNLDEDEFLPINPAQYYNSPPNSNHLYRPKVVSQPDYSKQPIRFSTPTPIFVTTQAPTPNYPTEPSPTFEYQEIEVHPPTLAPAPEVKPASTPRYQSIKVTTFIPDEDYNEKVKTSPVREFNQQPPPSIPEILTKLQKSNHLPPTLTPDNVDNSLTTLVKILNNIKQKEIVHKPLPPKFSNHADDDYDYYGNDYDDAIQDGSPGPNTGRPGVDYPNFHDIPETAFSCKDQRYKGFFGDPETSCQVWHYCDLNGGKASFLCPNGTIFSQVALTCDWWFNVKCSSTPQLYVLNERLYKFILPFQPKFPEDYSGPLVDKYLAIKFQEMEEKLRKEKAEEEEEAAEKVKAEKDNQNEVGEVVSASEGKPTTPSPVETIDSYSPDPVGVSTTTQAIPVSEIVSELPPVPQNIVEQERIEMIEVNNDGTSGHLTHSLE